MMDIKSLHRQAMEMTDLAMITKRNGNLDESKRYFRLAFDLEKKASMLLLSKLEEEPARSVLFRSAASLALDSDEYSEAEKLVCMALSGNPPSMIAEELRDILEQVHFKRHLDLRGIKLQEDEVQMSIAGEGIGFGFAPTSAFLNRVYNTERLLFRTAERRLKKPYRESGQYSKEAQENVALYMSVPRAASFAVTFRVGSKEQINLPGMSEGAEVIKEVLDCLDLYTQDKRDELRLKISDDAYFNNFISLADTLAPDGNFVNLVGFTILKAGKIQEVAIRAKQPHYNINIKPEIEKIKAVDSEEWVEITGKLLFADSKKPNNQKIQIIDARGIEHSLIVPEGMMDDVVRPLWNTNVVATGIRKGKKISLNRIIRETIS